MIKISFSGHPEAGKTSLLQEVKKILGLKYKVETVNEINRKNPFDEDKKSTFDSQFFYMTTQINEENIKKLKPINFLLCDRSILDQWIYWKNHFIDNEKSKNFINKNNILKELYRFWIKTYDLIFLIHSDITEVEKRIVQNEIRQTTIDYIRKIDQLFNKTVQEEQIKVIEVINNKTVDESAHFIISKISDYTAKPIK